MNDTYLVEIDLNHLRENLASAKRKPVCAVDVTRFLSRAGFRPGPDGGWIAEEADLYALGVSEIVRCRRLS